jgi:uncharacterized LabA/DUF88 family protein
MKKADWDVGLAVDAISLAPSLDVAVLVSGDGDFVPLVQYLKWAKGCKVEIVSFSRTTSTKLKKAGDEHINVEEIPNVFIRGGKQKNKK